MKTVNISFLKDNISAIIASLKGVGRINILDRDTPVAILLPYRLEAGAVEDKRLAALQKAGLVEMPIKTVDGKGLSFQPVPLRRRVDLTAVIREDRDGRD